MLPCAAPSPQRDGKASMIPLLVLCGQHLMEAVCVTVYTMSIYPPTYVNVYVKWKRMEASYRCLVIMLAAR